MSDDDTHTAENSKIYCKHVIVKEDAFGGDGAYAAKDFQEGELIEKGIVRPYYGAGEENPFIFTWSEDRTKWGMGSGCAPFYNTDVEENTNTRMVRNFDGNDYQIYAKKFIPKGEELLHTYKSLKWRKVFVEDEYLGNLGKSES